MATTNPNAPAASDARPGYKLTKLGWIPAEWEVKTLKEIGKISSGSTPARAQEERYFSNGDIPWVKTTDLNQGWITVTEECITPLALRESSCKKYPAETVLVAMYGGYKQIGRTGILQGEAAINQALSAIETDRAQVYPEYLIAWLNQNIEYWKNFAASSRKDPNITGKDVQDFPIVLPSLAEQTEIISFTTSLNAAINTTTDLIHAKRRYQQGLMQELLTGQRRFPEFAGQVEAVRLKTYLREVSVRSRSHTAHEKVLSVTNDRGFVEQKDQFTREVASADRSNYKLVRTGQFGYNPSRINVGSIALLDKFEAGLLSPLYTVFETIADKLDPQYLQYFFQTPGFQQQLKQQLQGSVRDILAFDGMGQLKLWIPTLPEQRRIAAVLTALAEELRLLTAQRAQWQQQKQGLLQALLTGAVRVKTN